MSAKVVRHNGILKIDIDGTLYNPLSFKSFRPNPQNISEFYNAGIRLFSVLTSGITCALGVPYSLYGESWIGENEYDFSKIDNQMDMFIQNAPDAFFAPMIQLDTRDWYLKLHPEVPNSFTHLSQIACDKVWKRAAADYMKAAIGHIEEKYGNRVYGYFLLCGTTTEWFSEKDFEASHPVKEHGYKEWTENKNAHLPTLERLNLKGDVFLTKIETLVLNAADQGLGIKIFENPLSDFMKVINTNVIWNYCLCEHAARRMKENGGGNIIFINSNTAYRAIPGRIAYSTSKGGQLGMMRAMALDLGRYNIRVNAVLPGMIKTDRWEKNPEFYKSVPSRFTPIGDVAVGADIADAVWYFAAHARNTTGAELVVDGGNTIQLYPQIPEEI